MRQVKRGTEEKRGGGRLASEPLGSGGPARRGTARLLRRGKSSGHACLSLRPPWGSGLSAGGEEPAAAAAASAALSKEEETGEVIEQRAPLPG